MNYENKVLAVITAVRETQLAEAQAKCAKVL
jgi:hypothetical protein